jgi:hypothetical protein
VCASQACITICYANGLIPERQLRAIARDAISREAPSRIGGRHEFKVDAARDPGAMMTAIEQNKRWMIITGLTMIVSVAGTLRRSAT